MKGSGSPTRFTARFACHPRSDPGQFHRPPDIFPSFEGPAAIEVLLPPSSTPLTRANVNPKQCPDPEVPAGQLAVCLSSLLLGSDNHSSSPVYYSPPRAAPLCIITPGVQLPCALPPHAPAAHPTPPAQHLLGERQWISAASIHHRGSPRPKQAQVDSLRFPAVPGQSSAPQASFQFHQPPGRAVAMPGALRNSEPNAGHVHSTSLSTAVCISLFLKQEE